MKENIRIEKERYHIIVMPIITTRSRLPASYYSTPLLLGLEGSNVAESSTFAHPSTSAPIDDGGVIERTIYTAYAATRSSVRLRTCIALLISWYVLSTLPKGRKYRQLSAVLSSAVGCFATVAYLSPIFAASASHGAHHHARHYGGGGDGGGSMGLVHASLLLLAINASLVGAALGSLLPRAAGGATLGYGTTILCEALLLGFWGADGGPMTTAAEGGNIALYYQFAGPTVAIVGGAITAR